MSHSDNAKPVAGGAPPGDTVTLKRLVDVLLFVGPSGCGKSTIINQLQQEWPDLFEFSVSHTTRAPRHGEVNGKHYHFVSFEEFQNLINTGAMIEYSRLSSSSAASSTSTASAAKPGTAQSAGNMYGTSKSSLHKVLNDNRVVLMDTDLLGAINIRRYCAHVVVDSKPVTVARKEKRSSTASTTATTTVARPSSVTTTTTTPPAVPQVAFNAAAGSSKSAKGRFVEVLPDATAAAQPPVVWQVPRLDISSVNLKCHSQLPATPPISAMPHASRLVRCMVIFIAPPSMAALEERLRERKSETEASFRMRMELNVKWMRWAQENQSFFDYYIVNDDLQKCYERVKKIVRAEVLAVASSL